MDVSTLTDTELTALADQVVAESQKRARTRRLLDTANNLVLDARNAGFSKAQVVGALTDVVNTYYPGA